MSHDCDYCPESFDDEDRLDTHVLLRHREEAVEDGYEYESDVSDGALEERDHEKGEQFGYE